MPPADRPVADIAGPACARAHAAGADGAAIDWRELSHELRTPLNAILGNAELLLDGSTGPLSAQARACLGEIQVAGRRLLRQVQLLLAWSELGASRPRPAACPVDVIALAREALADARPDVVHIEPHDARCRCRAIGSGYTCSWPRSSRCREHQARRPRSRGGRVPRWCPMRTACPCTGRCNSSIGPRPPPPALNRNVDRARRSLARLHDPEHGQSRVLATANSLPKGLVVSRRRAYCNRQHPVIRNSRSAAAFI